MAGYSPRPLAAKLGLKEGARGLFVAAPKEYDKTLGPLPRGFSLREISLQASAPKGPPFDFIHCFARKESELKPVFPALKKVLSEQGMLWISWPKRTAAIVDPSPEALDENKVRAIGLAAGLVDVKVCAVDEIWSGLKFVYRLKDRGK